MKSVHFVVHARSSQVVYVEPVELDGLQVKPLAVDGAADLPSLDVTFEQAQAALESQPRVFFEPDGSFLWNDKTPEPWQIEGLLQDRGGRLHFVELWGNCPPRVFDQLLKACGWPATPLMFFLVRDGLWLDEPQFRIFAGV